jgi:putative tricarboxylic transport membrane protein
VVKAIRSRRDADVPMMPDDDEEEGPEPPRSWSVAVPAGFFVVFVAAFIASRQYVPEAALFPGLVTALGATMAMAAVVQAVRKIAAGPQQRAQREAWKLTRQAVLRSFAWLAGYVALTYVLGALLAAVVFLPLFLRMVAEMRWRGIVLYTFGVVAFLSLLAFVADIALPIGYLTPVGML